MARGRGRRAALHAAGRGAAAAGVAGCCTRPCANLPSSESLLQDPFEGHPDAHFNMFKYMLLHIIHLQHGEHHSHWGCCPQSQRAGELHVRASVLLHGPAGGGKVTAAVAAAAALGVHVVPFNCHELKVCVRCAAGSKSACRGLHTILK